MLKVLRKRMLAYLSINQIGVLSISGQDGTWALPVRYRTEDLMLDCVVPRYADIAYHVDLRSEVLLVVLSSIPSSSEEPLRWLQYRGIAHPLAKPEWRGLLPKGTSEALAADLYRVIRLIPERIDLLDDNEGWGARETLEIAHSLSDGGGENLRII